MDAVQQWKEAGKAFKKADLGLARHCYEHAIQHYKDANRFNSAAKLYSDIAETFLDDSLIDDAIDAYRKSSECFLAEDDTTSSNKKLLECAKLLADIKKYREAIKIYEKVSRESCDHQLLRWSVKNYLFASSLCQLCVVASSNGSLENALESVDTYEGISEIFRDSRESKFIKSLLESMDQGEPVKFSEYAHDYDGVTTLDRWKIDRLSEAKKYFDIDDIDFGNDLPQGNKHDTTKDVGVEDAPDLF